MENKRHAGTPHQHRMFTWLEWTCGAPLDKFSDLEMHFSNSCNYMTRPHKFKGRWCI